MQTSQLVQRIWEYSFKHGIFVKYIHYWHVWVTLDMVGPILDVSSNNNYVSMAIDQYSNGCEARAIMDVEQT